MVSGNGSPPIMHQTITWTNSDLLTIVPLGTYHQISNISHVVGAAPTGDAPTTSERSTISLPAKVHLILEILWYLRESLIKTKIFSFTKMHLKKMTKTLTVKEVINLNVKVIKTPKTFHFFSIKEYHNFLALKLIHVVTIWSWRNWINNLKVKKHQNYICFSMSWYSIIIF